MPFISFNILTSRRDDPDLFLVTIVLNRFDLFRHEDALVDFASVLQLDKNLACAHCNIGVIHLTKTEFLDRAVRHFTDAVKSEPSYTRAYICRAQAYEKMKNVSQFLTFFKNFYRKKYLIELLIAAVILSSAIS